MTPLLIQQNIAKKIVEIEDKNFLEAINLLVSNKFAENKFELTAEMKNELDFRKANHKKGLSISYSWQTIKKGITLCALLLLIFSCKKNKTEEIASDNASILKSNTWYPEKIRRVSYNLNTNQFLRDTTYFTDSCTKNQRIKLFNDSLATLYMQCTAPYDKNGKWALYSDSIVVQIPYYLGYFYIYKGISPSKLIEVNNDYFITKETHIGGPISSPAPINEKEDFFTTYRKY